jgi:hypothetical protein
VKVVPFVPGPTVPGITVDPCLIIKEALLIEEPFMLALKVADITLLRATSTALSAGSVDTTGQTPETSPVNSSFLQPPARTVRKTENNSNAV